MKSIIRRLGKLEGRLGLAPETEFDRQLRARIEAGRRRLAEAKERGEWSGPIDDDQGEDLAGLSVIDILDRGRERVARAKAQKKRSGRRAWLGESRRSNDGFREEAGRP